MSKQYEMRFGTVRPETVRGGGQGSYGGGSVFMCQMTVGGVLGVR